MGNEYDFFKSQLNLLTCLFNCPYQAYYFIFYEKIDLKIKRLRQCVFRKKNDSQQKKYKMVLKKQ